MTSNVHKTLAKHILADGLPVIFDIEKSHGSYVVDQDGQAYLDMFSMFASSPVGYNHPYILDNSDVLKKTAINKLALSDIYPQEYADFMETFERVALRPELGYCFFIEGGALANENAMKAAFDWKTRLNQSNGIDTQADQVIHFKQAFHGRTGYTLSLTNTNDPRKYMNFPLFDWPRISNPKLTFPITEANLAETIQHEEKALSEIYTAIHTLPHRIACLIIEPLQSEGGDNHFRKEFIQQLRQICDEHDIILIFDEVQTGLAMTGKMWAFEHFDVLPDIVTFGKKSQVCGLMASKEKFDRIEKHVFVESSRINSTFGGNLVDMTRFKLILEIMEREELVDHAKETGDYLLNLVNTLCERKPTCSNPRGMGLMVAFDLPSAKHRDDLVRKLLKRQVLILGCGEKSIRFRPHLNVSREELDKALSIITEETS